jgi:adhesin/invasin
MRDSIASAYRRILVRAAAAGVTAAVMLALASCEGVPLLAPSGSSMMLVAGDSAVQVNGTLEITAILVQSGGFQGDGFDGASTGGMPVHNGTRVTFLATLGQVEPSEAETRNGRAVVRLVAGERSGIARITAVSGSATATLDVPVGAAAAFRVTVVASPQVLPAIGGTATIAARVEDRYGNPITSVPITFSTSAGSLATSTAMTDASGFATTTLTTTSETTVTATSPSSSGVVTASVKLTVQVGASGGGS